MLLACDVLSDQSCSSECTGVSLDPERKPKHLEKTLTNSPEETNRPRGIMFAGSCLSRET